MSKDNDNKDNNAKDNEIVRRRREQLNALREQGNPYPNDFRRDALAADLRARYGELDQEALEQVEARFSLAGRMMSRRVMGKASFAHLQDSSGPIQLFLKRDKLGEEHYGAFKKWDLGDLIGVTGGVFKTKTGELSVQVDSIRLLAKSLRPLPEKFHGLADQETRYRQRYLDLITNETARRTFQIRFRMVDCLRAYLAGRGFVEVETPMMQVIPGGAGANPFETHHKTLGMDLFLRVAPELYLKRLVVGGMEKVFEINRSFRNEGLSPQHNPEFTMLEFYWAYADYEDLMTLTEDLLRSLAEEVTGGAVVEWQGERIDLGKPFQRMTLMEATLQHNPELSEDELKDLEALRRIAKEKGVEVKKSYGLGKLQLELFEKTAEDQLRQPTFITGYPVEVSPLARRNDVEPHLTDRFELFIGGREIANGFSELNDPEEQARRLREQVKLDDEEAMRYDEDYIAALEYGMPPTAGEGIGIDRLAMLLTDSASIRDVILFPHLKRHERDAETHFKWGNDKFMQGDYRGAMADFDRAIELFAEYVDALVGGAIADYDRAIELNSNYVKAYILRGIAKFIQGDPDGAIADYDQAIKLNPNYAEVYNNRGVAKRGLSDYRGAIADYDRAIELKPDYVDAYNNRGNAKSKLGDYYGAITDYDRAIELKPDYAEVYTNRGAAKGELGDYDGAIADYDWTIEHKPEYADAYNNRGNAKSKLGDHDGAMADYNRAIELNPNDANAYYNRGNTKSDLGDPEGAIVDYGRAIELKPGHAEAYYNRGVVKSKLGDHSGAEVDRKRAIELNPDDANVDYNRENAKKRGLGDYLDTIVDYIQEHILKSIAVAFSAIFIVSFIVKEFGYDLGNTKSKLDDPAGAMAIYGRVIEPNPDYKKASFYRVVGKKFFYSLLRKFIMDSVREGIEFELKLELKLELEPKLKFRLSFALIRSYRENTKDELDDYHGAIADYDRAIELDPENAEGYYNRGIAKSGLDDYHGAIADYDRAIELNPNYAEAYFLRGFAKHKLGDYRGAKADYDRAIELKPEDADAYSNRGIAKRKLNDYAGAVADYSRAIELDPDEADAHFLRGIAKGKLGDHDGAIADYSRAIELDPDDANAYYNRGIAKRKLDDYYGAIADYSRAIELKPDYADTYTNRGLAKSKLGDLRGAIADFDQAIELKPEDADAYYNRGLAKGGLGDYHGAIADFDRAIELKPEEADAYYSRGVAKSKLGNKRGAAADRKRAIELDPALKDY